MRSRESVTNWKSFFRDICAESNLDIEQEKIGGEGFTIEIDESLVYKRKNYTGRLLANERAHTWVFGGICRENRQVFVVPIVNRDNGDALCRNSSLHTARNSYCLRLLGCLQ